MTPRQNAALVDNMHWIYTAQEILRPTLAARRTDEKLRRAVIDYLGEDRPDFIEGLSVQSARPLAVLCRPLATPNIELGLFSATAMHLGLSSMVLEYPDRFVTANAEKRALWRLEFDVKSRNQKAREVNLFDPNSHQGKDLAQIPLANGVTLREFHHLLLSNLSKRLVSRNDMSFWFNGLRTKHKDHYQRFMAIFMLGSVWFEDFLFGDRHEAAFVENVVLPSAEALEKRFGMKPLVCNFVTPELSQSPTLLRYAAADANAIADLAGQRTLVNVAAA